MAKLRWKIPLDPVELKDYIIDWSAEMTASNDTISASVWELPAEATAAGLAINDDTFTATTTAVWLNVPEAADQATIVGKGPFEIENTITTTGGRVLNQSAILRVADK